MTILAITILVNQDFTQACVIEALLTAPQWACRPVPAAPRSVAWRGGL